MRNQIKATQNMNDKMPADEFLEFAAGVLKVEPSALSLDTRYGSIPEWDSVNHLRLVMETESRFGVSYPIERIPAMLTLRDFLRRVQK